MNSTPASNHFLLLRNHPQFAIQGQFLLSCIVLFAFHHISLGLESMLV